MISLKYCFQDISCSLTPSALASESSVLSSWGSFSTGRLTFTLLCGAGILHHSSSTMGRRWDLFAFSSTLQLWERTFELTLPLLTSLPDLPHQSIYSLSSFLLPVTTGHSSSHAISYMESSSIIFFKAMIYISLKPSKRFYLVFYSRKGLYHPSFLLPFSLPSEFKCHLSYCIICLVCTLVWFSSLVSTQLCKSILLNLGFQRKTRTALRQLSPCRPMVIYW